MDTICSLVTRMFSAKRMGRNSSTSGRLLTPSGTAVPARLTSPESALLPRPIRWRAAALYETRPQNEVLEAAWVDFRKHPRNSPTRISRSSRPRPSGPGWRERALDVVKALTYTRCWHRLPKPKN